VEIGYDDYDEKNYQFFVKDNGIGIDKENQEKIFQEFHRVNDIDTEGTGIGLAIVKKIIESHKCNIWLDSKKGGGSTFYFTLPKPRPEE
jgi:signal transduction histidine kinase